MVVVDEVHKYFGDVHAVRGVSFELPAGQIAGLLGHNGAGKTTTLRMIAGFLMPDAGNVSIGGFSTLDRRQMAMRLLGYLPESTPLYNEMVVTDYLHFRGQLHGLGRAERTKGVERVVERCWLKEMRRRRIATLSKGYRQRVGLAAALLHEPKVLLLDEPTNGLDPTQIRETRELVRELGRERTMLISSHILPEVEKLCDRVIIFAGGRVGADGEPGALARAEGAGEYSVAARVESAAGVEAITTSIRAVAGVERVDRDLAHAGLTRWTVRAREGQADLREPIGAALRENGATVVELTARHPSLEAVFQRVMDAVEKPQERAA